MSVKFKISSILSIYIHLFIYLCASILILFAVASFFNFESQLSTHIQPWMKNVHGLTAAIGSITLLWIDIFLPIPSSVVMIANGHIFGLWIGALVSLIGGVGSSYIAFYIGRYLKPFVENKMTVKQQKYYRSIIQRWGIWAFIVSRPIPVMSESIALMSSSLSLKSWQVIIYSTITYLPFTFLYAHWGI
jgi:uncharacterized membrane protein YdjX (TVP38/TMEM64 family)